MFLQQKYVIIISASIRNIYKKRNVKCSIFAVFEFIWRAWFGNIRPSEKYIFGCFFSYFCKKITYKRKRLRPSKIKMKSAVLGLLREIADTKKEEVKLPLIFIGCGGRFWTDDLQVMSLTSYQAALPRDCDNVLYISYFCVYVKYKNAKFVKKYKNFLFSGQ